MKNVNPSDTNAKNELEYLKLYQKKGYTTNFRVADMNMIASADGSKFNPEQVLIVAEHRYEGMSNPSDLSILYVIETNDGHKGTIINAYGPAANLEIHEFIDSIPQCNISHDESILNLPS